MTAAEGARGAGQAIEFHEWARTARGFDWSRDGRRLVKEPGLRARPLLL